MRLGELVYQRRSSACPSLVPFVVVVSGVLGLLIGSFLNVVAVRVPAGASLVRESRCPSCDAAIKPWHNVPVLGWLVLRGRCASCGEPISARYPIVEAITGALFALVAWLILATSTGPLPATFAVLVAFLYFAAISVVLTVIDLDTHRLPNAIVLPSYVVAAVLFTTACVLGADWNQLLGAGIGMAVLYAFYFVIRLVRPDGMGGGDVKLAGRRRDLPRLARLGRARRRRVRGLRAGRHLRSRAHRCEEGRPAHGDPVRPVDDRGRLGRHCSWAGARRLVYESARGLSRQGRGKTWHRHWSGSR